MFAAWTEISWGAALLALFVLAVPVAFLFGKAARLGSGEDESGDESKVMDMTARDGPLKPPRGWRKGV